MPATTPADVKPATSQLASEKPSSYPQISKQQSAISKQTLEWLHIMNIDIPQERLQHAADVRMRGIFRQKSPYMRLKRSLSKLWIKAMSALYSEMVN